MNVKITSGNGEVLADYEFDIDGDSDQIEFDYDTKNSPIIVAFLRDCADVTEEDFKSRLN